MEELIIRLAKKRYGLGRMWRYVRATKQYRYISDLAIFRQIVYTLKKHGYRITNKSISYHFGKNVDPEDYENDPKVRREVLGDLFSL